ncbi:MAG TPA: hypothetical protein VEK35_11570 [Roseiarcus sp.]|nr:hypothetical protein [Roseiarcus sp.]
MYVLQLGYGGLYYSRWVGPNILATPDARWKNPNQPGNPQGGGSDVFPQFPPDPVPWSVAFLVSAASSKAGAANMSNKDAAQKIIAQANQAISSFLDSDDICPRWPFPGPPPWLSIIAAELTVVANAMQEGMLRAGILQIVGQILDRVALNPQPLPP